MGVKKEQLIAIGSTGSEGLTGAARGRGRRVMGVKKDKLIAIGSTGSERLIRGGECGI